MNNSIFKNLSYNVVLQLVLMVLPLVSIPYVSRVLGAEGIGAYSFTLSLTQYFIIVGTLGTALYGNRQIAYVRDDKTQLSKNFWSILIIRMASTAVSFLIYVLMFYSTSNLQALRVIQSFHILAQMIDITWFYVGLEEFKRIVSRNLLIKLSGLALIFILVKKPEDVVLYTVINLGMSIFSSLSLWFGVSKWIFHIRLHINDLKKHIKPIFELFIPQMASQVYVLLDKSMIGFLSSLEQVGFYTQAERIVRSILELTSALGVVMLPRMSYIFSQGNHEQMNQYLNKSLNAVSYISIPMAFGLMAVSPYFVDWFFGPGYESVKILMMMIAPVLVLISLSSVLGVQYLLPANRTKEFTLSIVAGALTNLSINALLIPIYGALGAVIGTLSAEFMVFIIQAYLLRDLIDERSYLRSLVKYCISGFVMFVSIYFLGTFLESSMISNFIQILVGTVIFFTLMQLMKDDMHQNAVEILLKRFKR